MKARQIIILSVVVVIVFGSVALMGVFSKMKKPPVKIEKEELKTYVNTQPVSYQTNNTQVLAYGRVKAAETLDLIAEISGRMTEGNIDLKEGHKFRKGDLLFRIDDKEAKLNLQSQKSGFLKDLAAILPDLKIDFSDSYEKWDRYFQSIDLDQPLPEIPKDVTEKEKIFLATKNIYGNYYSIKSAEANMRKYRFYAPFSGAVTEVTLQSGSFVNPGNKIAKIIRTDQSELKLDVAVDDLKWIRIGEQVTVTDETGTQNWEGRIIRLGDVVNQNTQSINVFVKVKPGKSPLYDGLYLKASIPGESIPESMEMPRNAVVNRNQVYVVEDSLLKVREVNILKINPQTVVFNGLEEGEFLVIEPMMNAHNNMVAWKESDRAAHEAQKLAEDSAKKAKEEAEFVTTSN